MCFCYYYLLIADASQLRVEWSCAFQKGPRKANRTSLVLSNLLSSSASILSFIFLSSQIVQLPLVAPTTFSFAAKSWSKLMLFNKHWLILLSLLLLDTGPKNHCSSLTSTAELCPRISSRQRLGCCVARCARCSRVLFYCPPRHSLSAVLPLALWWAGKKRPHARYIFLGLMFPCQERELRTES